jgi:hypothetical protein
MAGWILIPAGHSLFDAFDVLAPERDHASDGSIGDAAHQHEVSDHNPDETGSVPIHDADHVNEVHAIDVDTDLKVPGLTMETVVQFILGRCRSGAEKRLRYVIYNRRIWEADNSWRQRTYTGASAHTEHAHFSFSYTTSLEASTVSWHLEDIPVAMTSADKTWVQQQNAALVSALVSALTGTTPLKGADDKLDGTSNSKVGAAALGNGVPDPTLAKVAGAYPRQPAYIVTQHIGEKVMAINATLDALVAKENS